MDNITQQHADFLYYSATCKTKPQAETKAMVELKDYNLIAKTCSLFDCELKDLR